MSLTPPIPVKPPGQERPIPKHSNSGKIHWASTRAGIEGETAYWIWGDLSSGKIPLIVLHGGPGIPHGYMLPLALINQDYGIPVMMYDQIGCGESTKFKDRKGDEDLWTPDLFLEELDHVTTWLEKNTGTKHFDLLGHSWGATLASLYAIRRQPAGLRKLIISNSPTDLSRVAGTSARMRKEMPTEIQEVLDDCEAKDNFNSEQGMRAMIYAYTIHACRVQPWPQELLDGLAAIQEDDTVYRTMSGSSALTMKGSLSRMPGLVEDYIGEITEETCPGGMLVTSGQFDLCSDETMTKWFTDPKCRVKWVRFGLSSHFVMLEETEAFVRAVGMFLTSQ